MEISGWLETTGEQHLLIHQGVPEVLMLPQAFQLNKRRGLTDWTVHPESQLVLPEAQFYIYRENASA